MSLYKYIYGFITNQVKDRFKGVKISIKTGKNEKPRDNKDEIIR